MPPSTAERGSTSLRRPDGRYRLLSTSRRSREGELHARPAEATAQLPGALDISEERPLPKDELYRGLTDGSYEVVVATTRAAMWLSCPKSTRRVLLAHSGAASASASAKETASLFISLRLISLTPPPKRRPSPPSAPKPRRGLTYKEQRELAMLPTQIEALEAEQVTLHTRLEDADLFQRDPATFEAIMQRLTAMKAEVDTAYTRWEELERRQAQR